MQANDSNKINRLIFLSGFLDKNLARSFQMMERYKRIKAAIDNGLDEIAERAQQAESALLPERK